MHVRAIVDRTHARKEPGILNAANFRRRLLDADGFHQMVAVATKVRSRIASDEINETGQVLLASPASNRRVSLVLRKRDLEERHLQLEGALSFATHTHTTVSRKSEIGSKIIGNKSATCFSLFLY